MSNKELLKEFTEEFEKIRVKYKLTRTLEEYDSVFFFRDLVVGYKYFPYSLNRALCSRIVDTYSSWVNYLHNLIYPNNNYLGLKESSFFTDEDKLEMEKMISRIISLTSLNSLIGLTRDIEKEAYFLRETIEFWHRDFLPFMVPILEKTNNSWLETAKSVNQKAKDQNFLSG